MRNLVQSVAGAALALASVQALAEPEAPPVATAPAEASIPFANRGGVDNWRATDDRTVYFKDLRGNWFRATLFAPSFDLTTTEFIGIDASPSGALDKWSAIYVHGRRYTFQSFEKVEGPPPRRRHR